jgi:hypothetical protein
LEYQQSDNPSVVVRQAEPCLRYFITFACCGARLHGDESGLLDRHHDLVGSRLLEPDANVSEPNVAKCSRILMCSTERPGSWCWQPIQRHCVYRGWNLLAAHVRSNHVHTIVEAETRPERIMNEFKSYASRELNQLTSERPDRKRRRRHPNRQRPRKCERNLQNQSGEERRAHLPGPHADGRSNLCSAPSHTCGDCTFGCWPQRPLGWQDIDNSVPPRVDELLVSSGYDAIHVLSYQMHASSDLELLERACWRSRVASEIAEQTSKTAYIVI